MVKFRRVPQVSLMIEESFEMTRQLCQPHLVFSVVSHCIAEYELYGFLFSNDGPINILSDRYHIHT